jgi:ribosomal protein L7Ae-like RNA K-turn-binding protein
VFTIGLLVVVAVLKTNVNLFTGPKETVKKVARNSSVVIVATNVFGNIRNVSAIVNAKNVPVHTPNSLT